jgi:hypothetical protein
VGEEARHKDLEDLEREIELALGRAPRLHRPTPEENARWRLASRGTGCGRCGHAFEPGEELWRGYFDGRWLTTWCVPCVREKWPRAAFDFRTACDSCSRTFYRPPGGLRRHEFCSDYCRDRVRSAARREARHARMQHTCAVCGRPFTGRRDARVCSSACRQRAYRRRGNEADEPEAAAD